MGCSLICVNALLFLKIHYFSHNLPLFYTALPLISWTLRRFPGFVKPLPQKYAMGSDWLAGPVCCDSLNCLVQSRNVTPLTSVACAPFVLYTMASSILLINLSLIETQRILMKRIGIKNRCFKTLILKLVNPLKSLEDRILFSKAAQHGPDPFLHVPGGRVYVNFWVCDVTNPGSSSL